MLNVIKILFEFSPGIMKYLCKKEEVPSGVDNKNTIWRGGGFERDGSGGRFGSVLLVMKVLQNEGILLFRKVVLRKSVTETSTA